MNEVLMMTIPAAVTSIITYVFTRKKSDAEISELRANVDKKNAEIDADEINNVERVAKIWRDLSEDLRNRFTADIEEMKTANLVMKQRMNEVHGENAAMRHEMDIVRSENSELKAQLKEVLSENGALKNQMASLEKQLKLSKQQGQLITDQNKNLLSELKKFNRSYDEAQTN